MDELFVIFFVLALVLGVVTVIGHGMWVLLAKLFSGSSSSPRRNQSEDHPQSCPRCLAPIVPQASSCGVCDWPAPLPPGERHQEVRRAMARQLYHHRELGTVSVDTYRQLMAALGLTAPVTDVVPTSKGESPAAAAETAGRAIEPPALPGLAEEQTGPPPISSPSSAELPPPGPTVPTTDVASPAERVQQYVARRERAGGTAAVPPAASSGGSPRQALRSLLGSFLEEKNIRWGELVGGLLIICCSTALVISFWSAIAARPFWKFGIFNGVAAALFVVGFYTHHRWKIHTTSQGLLIIAILLVPLNFLAIAAFTDQSPPTDLISLSGEALSLVLFSVFTLFGARIITPDLPLLATVGVMVPSLMQLIIRRFVDESASLGLLYVLAVIPLGAYLAASCVAIAERARQPEIEEQAANRLFVLLGIVSYALLFPLALLLFKSAAVMSTAQRLAPLVVLCGLPSLVTGLLFLRRVTARQLSSVQTVGIAIGVLGALTMVGALVLAWPDPATLLPTALVNTAVFTLVACWFAIPEAHLAAGVSAMLAWVVAFHVLRGDLTWAVANSESVAQALLSASSGNALTPLVAVFLLISAAWKRAARRHDSLWTVVSAAVVALSSLALVTVFGLGRSGDPAGVTWTYAAYTLAAVVAASQIDRRWIAWVASSLLLTTLIQGVVFRPAAMQIEQPWIVALLGHATLMIAGFWAVGRWLRSEHVAAREVLLHSAVVTSVLAGVLAVAGVVHLAWASLATYWLWLGAVWLALAIWTSGPVLFTGFQIALAVAVLCGVTAGVETRAWYAVADAPWLEPWFLQVQGLALALLCLGWQGVRWTASGAAQREAQHQPEGGSQSWQGRWVALLDPPWPAFDRLCQVAIFCLLLGLTTYAALPGAAQELAPLERPGLATRVVPPATEFEFAGVSFDRAAGGGSWLLLAAVVAVLVVGLWDREAKLASLGLLLAASSSCPLLAARWVDEVSVASALRWLLAGFVFVGSIPVWTRDRLRERLRGWGIRFTAGHAWPAYSAAVSARGLLVALIVFSYLVMAAYVSTAAVQRAGFPTAQAPLLQVLTIWLFVATLLTACVANFAGKRKANRQDSADGMRYSWKTPIQLLLPVLGAGPLLVALAFVVAEAIQRHPIVGPEPGSWFREVGWSVSYGVPLIVFALTLLGYAIRERSSWYASAAGLLCNLVATVVCLLEISRVGRALDGRTWVEVSQLNCIVSAAVAIVWLAALSWHRRRHLRADEERSQQPSWPPLLVMQMLLTVALLALPLAPAVVSLFLDPEPRIWVATAGALTGWAAAALTFAAAVLFYWGRRGAVNVHHLGWLLVNATAILAATAARADTGNWLAYHTLLGCAAAAAWAVPFVGLGSWSSTPIRPRGAHAVGWSAGLAAATVLIALRALVGDPDAPWWTLVGLLAMTGLSLWLAWIAARRSFVWMAAVLSNVTASIWWLDSGHQLTSARGWAVLAEFLLFNITIAALAGFVSLVLERTRILPRQAVLPRRAMTGFHRFGSWACIVAMLIVTGVSLVADLNGAPSSTSWVLQVGALTVTALTAVACLWDPATRFPVASLYCLGLVGGGMFLDRLNFVGEMFVWSATLMLAAFALTSSYLWSQRERLGALAVRGGVPLALETRHLARSYSGHGWLVSANTLLAVAVTLLVFLIELTHSVFLQRIVASYALLAVALALAFLAKGTVRSPLQYATLTLGVLFAIAFAWAWMPVSIDAPLLHRTVAAAAALAVMIPCYGFGIVKFWRREDEWTSAARRLTPALATLAAVLLLAVLGIEVVDFLDRGSVAIRWPALVAVAAALAGMAVAALAAAVLPGRDPLGLSERGRTLYVYAAEAFLGLLFLHIRVTMPWLFRGWFLAFWPLVVMGIAFLGVGIAEWCQRHQRRVLSEPLENTGALLPLLPVLGYWLVPSQVNYSLVLLSVGSLYTVLCVLRRSFLFGILAVLAANGSLWYLLHSTDGLNLLQHPQLWLIPPAFCMLVAAHLNRARLSNEQTTAIRYSAAIVIYVSSTADVFVNGVGEAPWLPLVLGGLSLLGIFAGILFRVRAFLYLGVSFLLVALLTIVWHAAVELEMTWIWWVSGIVAGVAIIALFGLFEKKRDELLQLVEQVKEWEA